MRGELALAASASQQPSHAPRLLARRASHSGRIASHHELEVALCHALHHVRAKGKPVAHGARGGGGGTVDLRTACAEDALAAIGTHLMGGEGRALDAHVDHKYGKR